MADRRCSRRPHDKEVLASNGTQRHDLGEDFSVDQSGPGST